MSGRELAAYAAVTLEAELAGTEAGALKAGAAMERESFWPIARRA